MKATVTELKKKVLRVVHGAGVELSTAHPYWMNAERINVFKRGIEHVIRDGEENPTRRHTVTAAQKKSLDNWVAKMEEKYLK